MLSFNFSKKNFTAVIYKIKISFSILLAYFFYYEMCFASSYQIQTLVGTGTYRGSTTLENNGTHWDAVDLGSPNCVLKDPTDNSIIFYDTDRHAIRVAYASGNVSTILSSFISTAEQCLSMNTTTGDLYGTDGTNIFKMTKGSSYAVSILATTLSNSSSPPSWSVSPTFSSNCKYSISASKGIAYDLINNYLYFSTSSDVYQLSIGTLNSGHYYLTPLTSGFTCMGPLALNQTCDTLYVLDNSSSVKVIRQLSCPITDGGTAISIDPSQIIAGQSSGGSWFNSSGSSSTTVSLSAPHQISVDANNNVYLTDTGYIGKITGISGGSPVLSIFAGGSIDATALNTNLGGLKGIFVDDGNNIFITQASGATPPDQQANDYPNKISRIYQPTSITVSTGTTTTANNLSAPYYSSINVNGGGILSVGSDNSSTMYGGLTLSNSGTVLIGHANALGYGNADNILTLKSGTTLKAGSGLSTTVGSPSILLQPLTYSGTATIDTNGYVLQLSGLITSTTSNTLDIQGSGTIILNPNNSSTMQGDLKLSSGTTIFNSSSALGSGNLKFNGGTLKAGGSSTISKSISMLASSTLDTNNHSVTLASALIDSSGYNLTVKGGGSISFAVDNSSANTNLTLSDSNTTLLVSSQNPNYLPGGNLNFRDGSILKINQDFSCSKNINLLGNTTINTNNSTLTLTGGFTGSYNVTVAGGGRIVLDGDNRSFTGTITIADGTSCSVGTSYQKGTNGISLQSSYSVASNTTFSFPIQFSNNTTLDSNRNSVTLSETITSDKTLTVKGGGEFIVSGSNATSFTGGLTVSDPGTVLVVNSANALGSSNNPISLGNVNGQANGATLWAP